MKIVIEEFDIEDLRNSMHDWFGFDLTETQIEDVLKQNLTLAADISEWGLDTVAREKLGDSICRHIGVNREWPLNGDTDEYQSEFYKDLEVAAKKHGYIWLGRGE